MLCHISRPVLYTRDTVINSLELVNLEMENWLRCYLHENLINKMIMYERSLNQDLLSYIYHN